MCDTTEMVDALNVRIHNDRIDPAASTVTVARGQQVAVGDVIISRRNDPTISFHRSTPGAESLPSVRNGNRWRVAIIDTERNLVGAERLDDKARTVFDQNYFREHVSLGYAVTVHSAQGVTADTSIAVLLYLAERANSVVVVTTLSPNWLRADGMSLEGDNMHRAIAQLLLDPDREALNVSLTTATLKAGREGFAVPQQFVLAGHSAGGALATSVAGYYAEGLVARRADGQDAPNSLAGVVLLDGITTVGVMPSALDRLKLLQLSNGNDPADYVPIYQLGAPPNIFNSVSTAIPDLAAARPKQFIGVTVNGGVHMDAMLGGNPLLQGVAYLLAGIPQPQNPPGVQWLMAGWINDMFKGNIDPATGRCLTGCDGAYGPGGQTIDIDGDHGNAIAVVINSGSSPDQSASSISRFTPVAASAIPASVLTHRA